MVATLVFGAAFVSACGSPSTNDEQSPAEATRDARATQQNMKAQIPISAFGEITQDLGETCFSIGPDGSSKDEECPPEPTTTADSPAGEFVTALGSVRVEASQPPLQAVFVTFKSRRGDTCFDVQLLDMAMQGGVPLDCHSPGDCPSACLLDVERTDDNTAHVLGGTVPNSAQKVRIHFTDGTSSDYIPSGSAVPGLSGHRVFLINLGNKRYLRTDIAD